MAKSSKGSGRRPGPSAPAAAPDQLSVAQWISWGAILALVFTVPIAMSNLSGLGIHTAPLTYDQFDTIKVYLQRIFTIVAVIGWAAHMLTRGGKVRWTPIDWLVLAFLAWVSISSIVSISPATAVFGKYRRYEGLLSFINYAVVFFLVMQFADRTKRIRQLAITVFWSALVVNGYGVMQFLGIDPFQWGPLPFEAHRAFSTFGNPDLLGGYVVLSMGIALGLVFSTSNQWIRLMYWAGFFIALWCWIIAFTRGAWIGGALTLAIFAFGIVWQRTKWTREDTIAVAVVAIMAISVVAYSQTHYSGVMNVGERVASIAQTGEGSAATRFMIWSAALKAIEARPIFGFGADTFRLLFPMYKPYAYVAAAGYLSVADNVHNYPLQLAAGIGIPGLLLLYAIFVWTAIRSARPTFVRSEKSTTGDRALFLGLWAAAAGYIVSLTFGLSITGATVILWAVMGAMLAPTASAVDFKAPGWGIWPAAGIALLGIWGIFFWSQWFWADHYYLVARINGPGPTRTQAALTAARINPWNDMYRAEVGLAYQDEMQALEQLAYNAQQQGQNPQQYSTQAFTAFQNAVDAMKSTIAFVPNEYDNYVFLSNLYNNAGQVFEARYYQDAIVWARKGVALEPYGPAIRLQLARALLATRNSANQAEAISQLQYATKMDPAFQDGAMLLANVYKDQRKYDAAITLLKTLQSSNPSATGVSEQIAALEASRAASGVK